jgi:hypothetical protein
MKSLVSPLAAIAVTTFVCLIAGCAGNLAQSRAAASHESSPRSNRISGPPMTMEDMKAKCDMHKKMMGSITPEQHMKMMEEHMPNMSPEMRRQHMDMMEKYCA